jgi:acyl transferase domain-containing protein
MATACARNATSVAAARPRASVGAAHRWRALSTTPAARQPSPAAARQPAVLMFPGQGAQKPGMCRDLCDAFPAARHAVAEVEDALRLRLGRTMFEGTEVRPGAALREGGGQLTARHPRRSMS